MHKYDNELRQKVESMDAVPTAFQFDAASTWERMEMQLQPLTSKKKRVVLVYWAAASVVLVMVALIMFASDKKQQSGSMAKLPQGKQEQNIMPIVVGSIGAKEVQTTIGNHNQQNALAKKQIEKPATIAKLHQATPIDSAKKQEQIIVVQPSNSIETTPLTSNSNMTAVIKTVAAPQSKPRLKVVHINELDEPPPPVIAKLYNKKQLQEQDIDDASEPSKPFWQKKPKQVNASSSFTDNQ